MLRSQGAGGEASLRDTASIRSVRQLTVNMSGQASAGHGGVRKRTTHAAAFISQMETATTVNELGTTPAPLGNQESGNVGRPPVSKKQNIGDKEKERKWIRGNITMKICDSYKENPSKKDFCMCGRRKNGHSPDVQQNVLDANWSADSPLCVKSYPTTAYGEIEFPNANIAKFVRVADDTEMDEMMYLLEKVWGLQKPNLLISVTGGAKHIGMSKTLKDAFKQGLLKTAQTTGAWILSGGNNDGVMKYVGEAVNMIQSSRKVVAFGLAPWGCVANKRDLSDSMGVWPAYYELRDEVYNAGSKNTNLDPNHTHFVLVDNGTCSQFGTEINFRGLLEKHISQMLTDEDMASSTNVPVVCVVVEGGPGTLTTVRAAIDNATPVVILDGSGRAADMLAFAYNNTEEEEVVTYDSHGKSVLEKVPRIPDEIQKKLREKVLAEWPGKKNTDDLVQTIIHCVMRRHLIVVFSLDDKNTMKDMDIAILHAIMKANKNDAMNQLKLALAWNRIDVVKEEIFIDKLSQNSEELENILLTALIQNKVAFVELLMNHIHLAAFTTKKRLMELYNDIPKNHLLYKMLKKRIDDKGTSITASLEMVGNIIQSLVGDFYSPLYTRDERYIGLDSDAILGKKKAAEKKRLLRKGTMQWMRENTFAGLLDASDSEDDVVPKETAVQSSGVGASIGVSHKAKSKVQVAPAEATVKAKKRKYDFDWPARELFIWSVLMRRKELALLFLKDEKYAIAPALTASIMLRNMNNQTYSLDTEVVEDIERIAKEFEIMAIGVLGECFVADEDKSKTLLIRVIPSYGQTTLLQLAVEAGNREFVSHQACQNLLNNIWWGKMNELQREWRIYLGLFFPPFIYGFVQFRNEEELRKRLELRKKNQRKLMYAQKRKAQEIERTQAVTQTFDERAPQKKPAAITFDAEAVEELDDDDDGEKQLNCFEMMIAFYNAPKVTFLGNTLFYVVFLILFTYMMLSDFHPENVRNFSGIEITVSVWVITLFIEEIRQFWVAETNNFYMKVIAYIQDVWNIVDIGTVILYIVGFSIRIVDHDFIVTQSRLSKEDKLLAVGIDYHDAYIYRRPEFDTAVADRQSYSRAILSLALLAFWCRILHIFSVIRILGPKLVMIGRMIKDLLSFGIILAVFIAAFGIAQHAIMYPNEPASGILVYNVLRRPYWQMYGELFLEDLEGEELQTCVSNCTEDKYCDATRKFLETNGVARTCKDGSAPLDHFGSCIDNSSIRCYFSNDVPPELPDVAFPDGKMTFCYDNSSGSIPECYHDLDRCPETNRLVPVMLGVYILFTQILMFNLLIAMFSYTFTLVQENTDIHWKFQQYAMIKEYYTRPPLPPPLIVLNHIGLLLRLIYRTCAKEESHAVNDFKILLKDQPEKQLAVWERINFEDFCEKKKRDERESVEYKVTKSTCDLDQLMENAEAIGNLSHMYQRMDAVEDKLNSTGEALNWIMDALASNKMGKGKPPLLKIAEDEVTRQEVLDAEEKIFNEWKEKKGGLIHIKCRSSSYLQATRIRRFPVPNNKLYWEIDWPGYTPVRYTSDDILSGKGDYSDADTFKMSLKDVEKKFKFNEQDGDVCRVSFHGKYQLDKHGLPLNPFGRTGLTGRGALGRWGPNHALDAIVSRWKRFEDGDLELKNKKQVLEFIAVKRSDVDEWSLPGVLYEMDPVWRSLMAEKSDDGREEVALAAIKEKAFGDCMTQECKEALESISNPRIIYEGYCDDPRNTDNAWIETLAYNFHDDTNEVTKGLQLKPGERVSKVAWLEASTDRILFAAHAMIVKKLIKMHDAAP